MSQRGALILFIFVLIGGVLIGGWFFISRKETVMPPAETKTESRIFPVTTEALESPTTSTKAWKVYRNERYEFQFRYPTGWFTANEVDNSDLFFTDVGGVVEIALKTDSFNEQRLSECCPSAFQSPEQEDEIVRIHEGEIALFVSEDARERFKHSCNQRGFPHAAPQIETIRLESGSWQACYMAFVPYFYTRLPRQNLYLILAGGFKKEVQSKNFDLVREVAGTFRFR